jgi:hypothetical protein
LLYFVDKEGNSHIEKIIFNNERSDIMLNPYLEVLLKQKPWTDKQLEEAYLITGYYLNINNMYDLDNYLHYKAVNPMDLVRWLYFYIMLYSGIADTYRNEQFLKKPDPLYNLEMLLLNSNLNSGNKKQLKTNLQAIITTAFNK